MAKPASSTSLFGGGPTQTLPPGYQELIGAQIGRDVPDLRIQDNAISHRLTRELGAKAVSFGNDVLFARGHYRPHTNDGLALIAHEASHVADGSSLVALQRSADSVHSSVLNDEPVTRAEIRTVAKDPADRERLREAMWGLSVSLGHPQHVRNTASDILEYLEHLDAAADNSVLYEGTSSFFSDPADTPPSGGETDLSSMYSALEPEAEEPNFYHQGPAKPTEPTEPTEPTTPPKKTRVIKQRSEPATPEGPADPGHSSLSAYVISILRAGKFPDRSTLVHIREHMAAGESVTLPSVLLSYASESRANACQVLALMTSLERSGVTEFSYVRGYIEKFDESKQCDSPEEGPNWPNPDTLQRADRLTQKASDRDGGFIAGTGSAGIGDEIVFYEGCIGIMKAKGSYITTLLGKTSAPGGLGPAVSVTNTEGGIKVTPTLKKEIARIALMMGKEIVVTLQGGASNADGFSGGFSVSGPLGLNPSISADARHVTISVTIPTSKVSEMVAKEPDGSRADLSAQVDIKVVIDTRDLCPEKEKSGQKDRGRAGYRLPSLRSPEAPQVAAAAAMAALGLALIWTGAGTLAGAGLLVGAGGSLTLDDDDSMY